jgi:formyl-CoA transferase
MSSLLAGLVNQASGYLATGVPPRRMGNRHPSIAPYETLRCADGSLAVACGNDRQFGRLCDVLGRPDLVTDPRFADNPSRVAHRALLVDELERALAAEPAAVWETRLAAVDVPAGLVGDIGEAIGRATALGLEPLVAVDSGPQVRHPARYANARVASAARPPRLGEHSAAIRAWLDQPRTAPLPHPSRR